MIKIEERIEGGWRALGGLWSRGRQQVLISLVFSHSGMGSRIRRNRRASCVYCIVAQCSKSCASPQSMAITSYA